MLLTKAPRGTQDFTPATTPKLQYIERTVLHAARLFGFEEIRTPMFEHTELFVRSVGDTTDVVQKEMYTFEDKKGRSITLKPEGTAGAIRAAMENGLLNDALPLKVSYVTPCFRYEKQQAGRYRQFHQFGVELVGSPSPTADAETIALVAHCLNMLGVEEVTLLINSIGCPNCRPKYQKALVEYFEGYKSELCNTCLDRLEKNPLRLLDCKEERCGQIADKAPVMLDYLCDECGEHFTGLKARLDAMDVKYGIDPYIVRGLDYYTKTVFEFKTSVIGAQGTVCGGGRYDGLVELLGGAPTPAVGFAMGIERLQLVMEACGSQFPPVKACDIYFAPMGEAASVLCAKLATQLRNDGFGVQMDLMGRGIKAQMKYADKIGAHYTCVMGDNEIETGMVQLKNMQNSTSTQAEIKNFSTVLTGLITDDMLTGIADARFGGM